MLPAHVCGAEGLSAESAHEVHRSAHIDALSIGFVRVATTPRLGKPYFATRASHPWLWWPLKSAVEPEVSAHASHLGVSFACGRKLTFEAPAHCPQHRRRWLGVALSGQLVYALKVANMLSVV